MLCGLRRFLETWNTLASTGTSQSTPTRSDRGDGVWGGGRQKHHQLDLGEESSGVVLLLWQRCKPAFAGETVCSWFVCCLVHRPFFFNNSSALTKAVSQPA